MNHFFLSCSLAWSREFFALCHPKWEYVCRSVHVYQLRLGEWESENKMCSSYHWQQLHNSKALVHIGHNPNFFPFKTFTEHSFFSAERKRDAKEEEEKRQSTARSAQKMDSLCMICGVAFLPLVYLHWYQTNSRWQPSDSLSAIKRNANCQHTQRERERKNCANPCHLFGFWLCQITCGLLIRFPNSFCTVFAQRFVEYQFHFAGIWNCPNIFPVFVVGNKISMIWIGKWYDNEID